MSELQVLNNRILKCRDCYLCEYSGITVNNSVIGEGSITARLMIVGEAPGKDEQATGRPFVGRAGQLLDEIIKSIGLTRQEVYITNTVKHRPPNNRIPTQQEISACRFYLHQEIEIIQPEIIIALGLTAAKTLLGNQSLKMKYIHGQIFDYWSNGNHSLIIPTYHPASLLRDQSLKHIVWNDMRTVMEKLN